MNRKLWIAYHEAGHAVMARHLGLPLRFARINNSAKDGESVGEVRHLPGNVLDIWVLAAGYVTHLRAIGRKNSSYELFCASNDYRKIEDALALDRAHFHAYMQKLEDDVAGFLYRPDIWDVVGRFAEALAAADYLDANACMVLTDDVPKADRKVFKRTILDPTLHDHMGRRIGRVKLIELDRLLKEAVENLQPNRNPQLWFLPPLSDISYLLTQEGVPDEEAEKLVLEAYGDWPSWMLEGDLSHPITSHEAI